MKVRSNLKRNKMPVTLIGERVDLLNFFSVFVHPIYKGLWILQDVC